MDKLREKFEELAKGKGFNENGFSRHKHNKEEYANIYLQAAFEGFQLCYQALQQPSMSMMDKGAEEHNERYCEWSALKISEREYSLHVFLAMLAEFGGSDAN